MKKTTVVMLSSTVSRAKVALRILRDHTPPELIRSVLLGVNGIEPEEIEEHGVLDSTTGANVVRYHNEEPFNFSRNNNKTVGQLPGDDEYILFINDDVLVRNGWLEPMIEALETGPGVVVGIKLVYPVYTDYAHRIQHAGVTPGPNLTGVHRGLLAPHEAEQFTHPMVRHVWAVTGGCMVMRAADFYAVGGFNEIYQEECQDIDLVMAIRKLHGWAPASVVQGIWCWHEEGATRGGRSQSKVPLTGEPDRQRFLRKWTEEIPQSYIIDDETLPDEEAEHRP
jgi:GT2 family glycosyltransferase